MSFPKNPTSRQKRLLILDPQNVITKNDLIRTFQFPNKSVFLAKDLHYFNIRSTESFFWFWIHKMSFQQKPISHQNQLLVLDPQNDIPTILSL
jgi:hypothetical protein